MFFFFFPFLGQKTCQARISVKHTKLITISINTATKPVTHTQTTISMKYQAKIFSNLSQFHSISLTNTGKFEMFEEVQYNNIMEEKV